MTTSNDFWNTALSSLSRNIKPTEAFDQHIKPVTLKKVTNGVAHFHCRSVSLSHLENRLKREILSAMPKDSGIIDVSFEVAESKAINGQASEVEDTISKLIQPDTFQGFLPPTENWSKLPHEFIDALPLVETIGEMKIILYVLRHTWGYQDDEKKITLDEFEHGRKRRDGTRIDNGTGLTRTTIINGIKRAVKHEFLVVETDESDKARTRKYYSLKGV